MSNNDVCAMLKIPTIFLEKIICGTTDLSTFSVLLFFTNQLSVSCHLLKRHFSRCEIYREVTVYSSCTSVFYQSLHNVLADSVVPFFTVSGSTLLRENVFAFRMEGQEVLNVKVKI